VVEGLDIVLSISDTETDVSDKPKSDLVIADCGELEVKPVKPLKQQEI